MMLEYINFKIFIILLLLIVIIQMVRYFGMSRLVLKIGYQMYVKTPFGPWYFNREIRKANEQFENGLHSQMETFSYGVINVTLIPYGLTNYGFIIWSERNGYCIIIDPGHAAPFQSYLVNNNLTPGLILVTHKHHDHSYGVKILHQLYPISQIVCSFDDRIQYATTLIHSNHMVLDFKFGSNESTTEFSKVKIHALLVPGHTVGSVIYYIRTNVDDVIHGGGDDSYGLYFTGDTVFTASVGKMFECDASTYFSSIGRFMESLLQHSCPLDNIHIFPAHEYGLANLTFVSEKLNPSNTDAASKLKWCQSKRNLNEPTIPSTMKEEISFNPFLQIVLSGDVTLQAALSDKFQHAVPTVSTEEMIKSFSLPKSVSRRLDSHSSTKLSVRLFKEVRKLRDI